MYRLKWLLQKSNSRYFFPLFFAPSPKNLRFVAHWWTLCESHLLGLYYNWNNYGLVLVHHNLISIKDNWGGRVFWLLLLDKPARLIVRLLLDLFLIWILSNSTKISTNTETILLLLNAVQLLLALLVIANYTAIDPTKISQQHQSQIIERKNTIFIIQELIDWFQESQISQFAFSNNVA